MTNCQTDKTLSLMICARKWIKAFPPLLVKISNDNFFNMIWLWSKLESTYRLVIKLFLGGLWHCGPTPRGTLLVSNHCLNILIFHDCSYFEIYFFNVKLCTLELSYRFQTLYDDFCYSSFQFRKHSTIVHTSILNNDT